MGSFAIRKEIDTGPNGSSGKRGYAVRLVEAASPGPLQIAINTILVAGPPLLPATMTVHLTDIQYYTYGSGANLKHVAALQFYFVGAVLITQYPA